MFVWLHGSRTDASAHRPGARAPIGVEASFTTAAARKVVAYFTFIENGVTTQYASLAIAPVTTAFTPSARRKLVISWL